MLCVYVCVCDVSIHGMSEWCVLFVVYCACVVFTACVLHAEERMELAGDIFLMHPLYHLHYNWSSVNICGRKRSVAS